MERVTCSECVFWEAYGRFSSGRIAGKCHRYPPVLVNTTSIVKRLFGSDISTIITQNIRTNPDDWCGEGKPHAANDSQQEIES